MNLTKSQLKQIISEEVGKVLEKIGPPEEPVDVGQRVRATAASAKKSSRARSKEQAKQGITDHERGLMSTLGDQLLSASKVDNLMHGAVFRYAKLLSQELVNVLSHSEQPETAALQSALSALPPEDEGEAPLT
jgi:hypothetical protein